MKKSILFFALCCLAFAQRDNCPRIKELLTSGCIRGCITVTQESFPCPTCNDDCTGGTDECTPDDPMSCGADQTCLAVGVAGSYTCVNSTAEGGECVLDDDAIEDAIERIQDLLPDLEDREIVSELSDFVVPCAAGLVCRRQTLERSVCTLENENGPCSRARADGQDVECDEDGNFEPLQCLATGNGMFQCSCVEPTGEVVSGTEVVVEEASDVPDCEDTVNDRCRYRSALGFLYEVRSGETFVDPETCSRCLCRDGSPVLCGQPGRANFCTSSNPGPIGDGSCTYQGETLANGESVNVDCNRCMCRNGRLVCTRRTCEDEDDEDDLPETDRNCRMCGRMRADPVCGNDGRTYPSECFAVNCAGLDSDDITAGPCSRRNVCDQLPCDEGEFCLRMGGVTCLSRRGCDRTRFRRCIDPETLTCANREDDDDDDDDESEESPTDGARGEESGDGEESFSFSSFDDDDDEEGVCGDDGITYSSICNLLQNAGLIQVAYAGSCNQTECSGGEVCGTDGETYDNICELRAVSANARVEHRGACADPDPDELVNERCMRIRESGMCADLADCETVVIPEDGCCPVCGGAVTIGLDREGLDDYIELNPSLDTVDELLKRLIASGFIPEQLLASCGIEVSLLQTGDLHILLENKLLSDNACFRAVEAIADAINNPPGQDSTGRRSARATTDAFPQVLQFATVAQTSPLESSAMDGAVPLGPSLLTVSMLLLMIAAFWM